MASIRLEMATKRDVAIVSTTSHVGHCWACWSMGVQGLSPAISAGDVASQRLIPPFILILPLGKKCN